MRDIACRDCVVSVLIEAPKTSISSNPDSAISELGSEESRVIDLLASRGMIPPLRYAQHEGNPLILRIHKRSQVEVSVSPQLA